MKKKEWIIIVCLLLSISNLFVGCGNTMNNTIATGESNITEKNTEEKSELGQETGSEVIPTYDEEIDVFLINNNVLGEEYADGNLIDMNTLEIKGGKIVTESEINLYDQRKLNIGYVKSGVTMSIVTQSDEWTYVYVTDGGFIVRTEDIKDLTVVFASQGNIDDNTKEEEPTYTVTDITDKTMYAKQFVNLRSGPSIDYEKVGSLTTNQEVTVTGQANNGWYRIDYNGGVAFVSNNYLSDTKVEITTPSNNGGNTNENENNSSGDYVPPTDEDTTVPPVVEEPTYTYTVDEVITIVESTLRAAGFTKPEESMTPEQLEKYGPTDGMGWGYEYVPMDDPYTYAKSMVEGAKYWGYNVYYLEYQGVENGCVWLISYWGTNE